MSLFARLFAREFIGIFLLSWGLFSGLIWLFMFLSNIFVFLSSPLGLGQYLFIELKSLPTWVELSLPLAWLFALCVAISNLRASREWLGIWEAGVSTARIRLPYLVLAFLLGAGSLIWQDFLSFPLAVKRAQERVDMLGLAPESRELIFVNEGKRNILWAGNFNPLRHTIEQPSFFMFDGRGNLAWSVQGFTAYLGEDKVWVFREARVWSYRGGEPRLSNYHLLRVVNLGESPATLALARGDWALSTLRELFLTAELIRSEKKEAPLALEAQIYSRILKSLSFAIMVFWAFWISFRWSSTNLLFTLMSSLSFNLIYTILHLVLVQLSTSGILSPLAGGLLEIAFWIGLLWTLYRYYRR